ncbi:FkbM family methyltransferase [Duganella qianjiadongensis]|uniref:FkbM family methyltransferase n=1 Tax=Duganella qianjiadongensis TaxID=2692176 RepID=A0ABW9VGE9_9BURK|nr:FkbM family methyltransferase [Duganella qianjiadongensis]MYM38698.1 FkbM family methyltransferase [Duganella qianjiadongensis]
MSFLSYAQNYEDVLLWRALQHVPNGFYIDVGANDPELHSVTKAFYDAGWSGINIEPMPSYGAAFREQRTRDINLNVAAGASSGSITLFDVPDVNGWASTDASVAANHRAHGHAVVEHTVPLLTLTEICRQHVRGPVHFLKVDVEGFEADVLRGMDFSLCRPWIVVVEAIMPNSRDSNHLQWEHLVTDHQYRFVWFDGLNRYYVAEEHAELAQHLQVQPNVFDDYLTHHLDKAWQRNKMLDRKLKETWELSVKADQRASQLEHTLADTTARLEERAQQLTLQTLQLQADLRQAEATARQLESNLHQTAAWGKDLEQRLLAVYASSSWRITAPLRFIMRRGDNSLPNLARRAVRGAIRRAVRWLTSREMLRRALLPIIVRSPMLSRLVSRSLHVIKQGGGPAAGAADVPHLQRELPLSARKVLDDLRRAQHKEQH